MGRSGNRSDSDGLGEIRYESGEPQTLVRSYNDMLREIITDFSSVVQHTAIPIEFREEPDRIILDIFGTNYSSTPANMSEPGNPEPFTYIIDRIGKILHGVQGWDRINQVFRTLITGDKIVYAEPLFTLNGSPEELKPLECALNMLEIYATMNTMVLRDLISYEPERFYSKFEKIFPLEQAISINSTNEDVVTAASMVILRLNEQIYPQENVLVGYNEIITH